MLKQEVVCRVMVVTIDESDFGAVLQAILESSGFDESERELWDLSGGPLSLTVAQIKELAVAARGKASKPRWVALVAEGDLFYGLLRIYASYREESGTKVHVTRNREDALQWLESQDDD